MPALAFARSSFGTSTRPSSPRLCLPPARYSTMAKPIELTFQSRGKSQVDIGLDFYVPSTASANKPAPVMVWWHGGGLLMGGRKPICPHQVEAPDRHFLCIVSADYRLAPQARMDSMMEDVADAVDFVRTRLPADLAAKLDTTRLATCGSSAGGWLSLLAGTGVVTPPPKVVLAIYPITSSTDAFFTTPQKPKVSYEEAPVPLSVVAPYIDSKAAVVSGSELSSPRMNMYSYMLQEGILTDLLFTDTTESPQDYEIVRRLDRYTAATVPPIYIVHGDADDKVAVSHARTVASKLKNMGAKYEYEELPGKNHLFDIDPSVTLAEMYAFLAKYL